SSGSVKLIVVPPPHSSPVTTVELTHGWRYSVVDSSGTARTILTACSPIGAPPDSQGSHWFHHRYRECERHGSDAPLPTRPCTRSHHGVARPRRRPTRPPRQQCSSRSTPRR